MPGHNTNQSGAIHTGNSRRGWTEGSRASARGDPGPGNVDVRWRANQLGCGAAPSTSEQCRAHPNSSKACSNHGHQDDNGDGAPQGRGVDSRRVCDGRQGELESRRRRRKVCNSGSTSCAHAPTAPRTLLRRRPPASAAVRPSLLRLGVYRACCVPPHPTGLPRPRAAHCFAHVVGAVFILARLQLLSAAALPCCPLPLPPHPALTPACTER